MCQKLLVKKRELEKVCGLNTAAERQENATEAG